MGVWGWRKLLKLRGLFVSYLLTNKTETLTKTPEGTNIYGNKNKTCQHINY